MSQAPDRDTYTLPEAGRVLGLRPASLRQAIHRGTLQADKRGRDWHVTLNAIRWYELTHLGQRRNQHSKNQKSDRG